MTTSLIDSNYNLENIRNILLKLSTDEKKERIIAKAHYHFYQGVCKNKEKAKLDKTLIGQSWENADDVDYEPTQDIRNKVKPLLKKQARWMFGKEPDIIITPINIIDKEKCEELRQFLDNILKNQHFWRETRKAFLTSTIKKRVLLRISAENSNLKIRYDDLFNFSYDEIDGTITRVRLFQEDLNNSNITDETQKIYYIHIFSYEKFENNEVIKASYTKETYRGDNLNEPINSEIKEIGFENNILPVWVIKNGGELGDDFGESDLQDLIEPQKNYNKKVSDFADALRFQMFGADSIIDGDVDDVSKLRIAPNAIYPIRTDTQASEKGKQAIHNRIEYSMNSSSVVNDYLESCKEDMNYILDMPNIKDLNNIPSAKAMRYLYNDLVARCEEKWNDWEPILLDLFNYILSIAPEIKLPGYKKEWATMQYTISLNHNYPIPSDEEDKKRLAIEEVLAEVRTRNSYIKEFSKAENSEEELDAILEEKSLFEGASLGEFSGKKIDNIPSNGENEGDEEEE